MKKVIAVVDDDQAILEVLTLILVDAGYTVHQYHDGATLLDEYRDEKFHLILLDYRLPKKNGVEIAKEVKERAKNKIIPIIIISANHNVEFIKKLDSVDDFIAKPFELNHLVKVVDMHISRE